MVNVMTRPLRLSFEDRAKQSVIFHIPAQRANDNNLVRISVQPGLNFLPLLLQAFLGDGLTGAELLCKQ